MDWLNEIIKHYDHITRNNPLAATLLIPIVGGLVASVIYLMKSVPAQLWALIKRNMTVTMALNNAGWDGNIDAYTTFDKWFMQTGFSSLSRNFFMFRQWNADLVEGEAYKPYRIGIGNGTHFFFYSGRFFWFTKGRLDSSGSERLKEEIKINTFGWNGKCFANLVDLFNERKTGTSNVTVHSFRGNDGWTEFGKVIGRDIETFCMNKELRTEIINKIQRFIDRREWYQKKGLTHKTSFLFFGPPGTGKTTLAKLLAYYFRRDIFQLDLSTVTNQSLPVALANVKPGSFLLVEDVDQAGSAVRNRKKKEESGPGVLTLTDDFNPLTMSGVLNAFDGVVGLDNLIIIFTSNHPEDLDPAIRRKSRIDNEILIGHMTSVEIYDYILLMYDDMSDEHAQRVKTLLACNHFSIPGCEVENAFKENPDNPIKFLADIHACHINHLDLAA